jgi:short-subunit dehydrogenase
VYKDRVVLITGGGEGIGAACVREFLRRGARLSVVDLRPRRDDASGAEILWTVGDITDIKVQRRVVDRTLARYRAVDILVNNVGIGLYAAASTTTIEQARKLFEVNFFAAVSLTRLVIPGMLQKGSGGIINISSVGALVALPWSGLYCATKSAMHAYSEALRRELAAHNIHVLTVAPGIVRTAFRQHVIAGEAPGGVAALDSIISPDDLAVAIADGWVARRRRLYEPRSGRLFALTDWLVPSLMDWFLRRCWTRPPRTVASHEGARAMAERENCQ